MWRRRWLSTLLTTSLLASNLPALSVVAAEPAESATDLEHDVRRLLGDLAGPTRAERAGAEKRLMGLGPKILPFLPAPELLPSVSVRDAVRRIRFELERTAARDSVLPSRVTLVGKMSIGDVLTEMTRQTGKINCRNPSTLRCSRLSSGRCSTTWPHSIAGATNPIHRFGD